MSPDFISCLHLAQAVGAGNLQGLPYIFQRCIIFMMVRQTHMAMLAGETACTRLCYWSAPPGMSVLAVFPSPSVTNTSSLSERKSLQEHDKPDASSSILPTHAC